MASMTHRHRMVGHPGTGHVSTVDVVVRFLTIMVLSAALTFIIGAALLSRS